MIHHIVPTLTLLFVCGLCSNTLAGEWKPLFDGLSLSGWTTEDGGPVTAEAWEAADGMLHLNPAKGKGGNLLTDRAYSHFELIFEWIMSPGGNNGIKYRVNDFDGRHLGIEYQVFDDLGNPKLAPKHKTASLYDIYPAKTNQVLNPSGTVNRGRIVVRGDHIEHWLNGHLVAEAEVGSPEWDERIAESKFDDVAGFGRSDGRIMLTDHNDEVWYRNIFIRELDSTDQDVWVSIASCVEAPACCPPRQRRGLLRRMFRHR